MNSYFSCLPVSLFSFTAISSFFCIISCLFFNSIDILVSSVLFFSWVFSFLLICSRSSRFYLSFFLRLVIISAYFRRSARSLLRSARLKFAWFWFCSRLLLRWLMIPPDGNPPCGRVPTAVPPPLLPLVSLVLLAAAYRGWIWTCDPPIRLWWGRRPGPPPVIVRSPAPPPRDRPPIIIELDYAPSKLREFPLSPFTARDPPPLDPDTEILGALLAPLAALP